MSIGPKKILCITSTGIGNAVLYTPVLRTLKKSYQGSRIDVIAGKKAVKEMLTGFDGLNEITVINKKNINFWGVINLIRNLRKKRYDILITSFLDKSFKIAVFSYLTGIPVRVGYDNGWWGIFYNKKAKIREKKHEVEYNLDLLKALGINELKDEIELPLSSDEKRFAEEYLKKEGIQDKLLIGIHPGAGVDIGGNIKRWNHEKFAELSQNLIKIYNAEILFFGGPEEETLSRKISGLMSSKPKIVTGTMNIKQTAAIIGKCKLFISNDSGLMHIAASQKVPVVAIFGPTLFWKNYPWQVKHKIIRKDIDCAPCYDYKEIICDNIKCLKEISAGDVLGAIKELRQKND